MNETTQNPVTNVTNRIDWSLVITLIVAAILLAAIVFGMKKSGIGLAKSIASNV